MWLVRRFFLVVSDFTRRAGRGAKRDAGQVGNRFDGAQPETARRDLERARFLGRARQLGVVRQLDEFVQGNANRFPFVAARIGALD
jgi:hypothetical protein